VVAHWSMGPSLVLFCLLMRSRIVGYLDRNWNFFARTPIRQEEPSMTSDLLMAAMVLNQLWTATRGEQRNINRWATWARLRRQRKEEKP
jgi:hypothetical protein